MSRVVIFGMLAACLALTGCKPVSTPDVVGMARAAAETAVTDAGMTLGTVEEEFSAAVPAGEVVSQDPAAGTRVASNAPLNLVVSKGPEPPQAAFLSNKTAGVMPLTVQFMDTSTPGDAPITAWHWLFGDGAESAAQDPSHVYTAPGNYNVSLEVTTAAGTDAELKLAYMHVSPPEAGTIETVMLPGSVPLEMAWIPAGSFTMGSPDTETAHSASEAPQHLVAVNGFWMARYELTKRQWQAVMGTTPWEGRFFVQTYPESPAVWVSWDDARDFVDAVNVLTGKAFRLPSEAEWEYAYRAGTADRFYWGDDPAYTVINDYAWWDGNANAVGQLYAHLAGQKSPNTWGLYDMAGNVWEWCEDDWHADYSGAPADGRAWAGTPRESLRVFRGGGWSGTGEYCRAADRRNQDTAYAYANVGFRLAR